MDDLTLIDACAEVAKLHARACREHEAIPCTKGATPERLRSHARIAGIREAYDALAAMRDAQSRRAS